MNKTIICPPNFNHCTRSALKLQAIYEPVESCGRTIAQKKELCW
jgi:hypothetical protein